MHSSAGISCNVRFFPTLNYYAANAFTAFSHVENNPRILANAPSRVTLVGFCTGLIPAAAVASATSISDVLEIAPELVCISLRLGLAASRRSMQSEPSSESWATVVLAVPRDGQQKEMDEFHEDQAGFESFRLNSLMLMARRTYHRTRKHILVLRQIGR